MLLVIIQYLGSWYMCVTLRSKLSFRPLSCLVLELLAVLVGLASHGLAQRHLLVAAALPVRPAARSHYRR